MFKGVKNFFAGAKNKRAKSKQAKALFKQTSHQTIDNLVNLSHSPLLKAKEREEINKLKDSLIGRKITKQTIKDINQKIDEILPQVEKRRIERNIKQRENYVFKSLDKEVKYAKQNFQKVVDLIKEYECHYTYSYNMSFKKPKDLDVKVEELKHLYREGKISMEEIKSKLEDLRQFNDYASRGQSTYKKRVGEDDFIYEQVKGEKGKRKRSKKKGIDNDFIAWFKDQIEDKIEYVRQDLEDGKISHMEAKRRMEALRSLAKMFGLEDEFDFSI